MRIRTLHHGTVGTLALLIAATLGWAGTALPQCGTGEVQVDLPAVQDNTIYSESDSVSNGSGTFCFAGRVGATGGGAARRALLRFDVAATLPAGATVESVTLTLHMSKTNFAAGARTVALHRVSGAWGEGSSDATFQEGSGAPATANDATWKYGYFDTTAWVASGGDFQGTASASTSVDGIGFYSWSSPALAADVQGWLDAPGTDFGWIVLGDESVPTTAKRFDTKENTVVSTRPVLSVCYTPATGSCPIAEPGDVDLSSTVTSSDIIVLVNFVFKGGADPAPCPAAGDVNCSGQVTSADIIVLVNYVFKGGSAPCDPCTIIPSLWSCP